MAEIIQRVRPDVLLINEFDFDADGAAAVDLFQQTTCRVPHNGAAPIEYPYRYVAPSNTGIPSGFDLNNDGMVGGPDDAFGFGFFPGQFGMAVYSMHPIDARRPPHLPAVPLGRHARSPAPDDRPRPTGRLVLARGAGVAAPVVQVHWDLPVDVDGRTVHVLASHPTPPVFDGPEDRNGRRNHDEIRFWADYVRPGAAAYIFDDAGQRGGLRPSDRFVIIGDLNADPSTATACPAPRSCCSSTHASTLGAPVERGSRRASRAPGRRQRRSPGRPRVRHRRLRRLGTRQPAGRLRAPLADRCASSTARSSGPTEDPLFRLVGDFPFPSSDHRLVSIDVAVPGGPPH